MEFNIFVHLYNYEIRIHLPSKLQISRNLQNPKHNVKVEGL